MYPLATTTQMKELDRIAIEDRGIPSLWLMEHAAYAVTEKVLEITEALRINTQPRAAIFCGPGNNGGDGIAAARLLMERGVEVRSFLIGKREKMTEDARVMEEKLLAAGGRLESFLADDELTIEWLKGCHCMVDALFGVGLKRPITGEFLNAVQLMNKGICPVAACDIPSGIDGDSGEILGGAVHADYTITFTCGKPGLYQNDGKEYAGKVEIASIGIPDDLVRQMLMENNTSSMGAGLE